METRINKNAAKVKVLSAAQVRRLKPGTIIEHVNDKTGERGSLIVAMSYKKKVLHGIGGLILDIKDREGWHFELPGVEP